MNLFTKLEYFEGDLDTMIDTICSLRNFTCNKETSISKYYNEFSELSHKYKRLEDDYFNVVEQNKQLLSRINELKLELEEDVSGLTSDNGTNEGDEKENTFVVQNREFKCSKCNKTFSRIDSLKRHEQNCEGYDKRQCKICLKMFATPHGKYNHMKNVKCSPPL